jgi:hypothetical protein
MAAGVFNNLLREHSQNTKDEKNADRSYKLNFFPKSSILTTSLIYVKFMFINVGNVDGA